ncbi:hypothetical protein D3C72_912320 [compost metagenome]
MLRASIQRPCLAMGEICRLPWRKMHATGKYVTFPLMTCSAYITADGMCWGDIQERLNRLCSQVLQTVIMEELSDSLPPVYWDQDLLW